MARAARRVRTMDQRGFVMREARDVVIPLRDHQAMIALGAHALWMLGVGVVFGVVVVAGLATAVLAVRASV